MTREHGGLTKEIVKYWVNISFWSSRERRNLNPCASSIDSQRPPGSDTGWMPFKKARMTLGASSTFWSKGILQEST